MSIYIFDFDGTIADSFSLACDLIRKHALFLGCKSLSPLELEQLKNKHARDALHYLEIPFWKIPFFVQKMRKLVHTQVDKLTIFPEWPMLLNRLTQQNHTIGLISSNSKQTVEYVLKKYQVLELFDFIACGKSIFGKKNALLKLMRQKKLLPSMTYYIGDEVRDIEAAHALKIQSVGVSWGFNSHERLVQANPNYLANNMNQLISFLL